MLAAYSPSQLAWSKSLQPLGTCLHSSNEPSELS